MSDLYHPLILKHSREPLHFHERKDAEIILDAYNPICGDDYKIYLDLVDDHLEALSFDGYGCAVSKASASLLAQKLGGKSRGEAHKQLQRFLEMVTGSGTMIDEDLAVFAMAKKYPGRITCVTLAWQALDEFLSQHA